MKTKTKKIKPIDYDAHFKYACPNCGIHHWASLKEVKTFGFIIVCDCNEVFSLVEIKNINIVYNQANIIEKKQKTNKQKPKETTQNKQQITQENKKLPIDKSDRCVKILCALGYIKSEAISMIDKAFNKSLIEDSDELIKYAIKNFGVYNEEYN